MMDILYLSIEDIEVEIHLLERGKQLVLEILF